MRKPVSILLSFIFLFNIGGHYVLFRVTKMQIKHQAQNQIRQRITDKDLCLIVVPDNTEIGIHWLKRGKEFIFKGEMYDVVRAEIKVDKKYYYCIRDKKEKELIANYLKTTKSKKDTDKKLKRVLTERYFPRENSSSNIVCSSHIHYTTIEISLLASCLIIPTPPPKSV